MASNLINYYNQQFNNFNVNLSMFNQSSQIDECLYNLLEQTSTIDHLKVIKINSITKIHNRGFDCSFLQYHIILQLIAKYKNKKNYLCMVMNLPIQKFVIDIDCKKCKELKRTNINILSCNENSYETQNSEIINLITYIQQYFEELLDFIYIVKPCAPYCGIHIIIQNNIDFIIYNLLNYTLNQYKCINDCYVMDIPTSFPLPLSRNYVDAYDSNFKKIDLSTFENLLLLSPIDIWKMKPFNAFIEPLIDLKNNNNYFLSVNFVNAGLPTATYHYALNNKISFSINKNTYTFFNLNNHKRSVFQYKNSTNNIKTQYTSVILNYFKVDEKIDIIVYLDKTEEYYEQKAILKEVTDSIMIIDDENFDTETTSNETNVAYNFDGFNEIDQSDIFLNFSADQLTFVRKYLKPNINNDLFIYKKVIAKLTKFDVYFSCLIFLNLNSFELPENIQEMCANPVIAFKKMHKHVIPIATKRNQNRDIVENLDPDDMITDLSDDLLCVEYLLCLIQNSFDLNFITSTLVFLKKTLNLTYKNVVILLFESNLKLNRQTIFLLSYYALVDNSVADSMLDMSFDKTDLFYAVCLLASNEKHNKMGYRCVNVISAINDIADSNCFDKTSDEYHTFIYEHVLHVRSFGQGLLYFNGRNLLFTNDLNNFNVQFMICFQKQSKKIQTQMFEKYNPNIDEISYFYFTPFGLYNPITDIYEQTSSCCKSRVFREMSAFPQSVTVLCLNKKKYIHDTFFKVENFMRSIIENAINFFIRMPLAPYNFPIDQQWFQTKLHFDKTDSNIILEDVNIIFNHKWSMQQMKNLRTMTCLNVPHFYCLFQNILGIFLTLYYKFRIPNDPASILLNIFGNAANDRGLPPHNYNDNKLIISQLLEINSQNDCNLNDDNALNKNSIYFEKQHTNDSSLSLFLNMLQNKVKAINYEHISSQLEDNENKTEDMVFAWSSNINDNQLATMYDYIYIFTNINLNLDLNVDFISFENIPDDFLKLTFMLTIWFIKMGDSHILYNTKIFNFISKNRDKCFQEICNITSHLRVSTDIKDLGTIFFKYTEQYIVESKHWLIENKMVHKFNSELLTMNSIDCNADDLYQNDSSTTVIDDKFKIEICNAYAYFIIQSEYNFDRFVEFSKMFASIEYIGNFNKICYLLYGASNGGKNQIIEMLNTIFDTPNSTTILLAQKFTTPTPVEQNPNASILSLTFFCNLDEVEYLHNNIFKKACNIGFLETRPIHSDELEQFRINSKLIITTNNILKAKNPNDAGWNSRIWPISILHSYCDLVESIDRSPHNHTVLGNQSQRYVEGQYVMRKYPTCLVTYLKESVALLTHFGFKSIYFYNIKKPTSKKMTNLTRDLYDNYLLKTSPMAKFMESHIVKMCGIGLTRQQINEIIADFWNKEKETNLTNLRELQEMFLLEIEPYYTKTTKRYGIEIEYCNKYKN